MGAIPVRTQAALRKKVWECLWPAGVVIITGIVLQSAGWGVMGFLAIMAAGMVLLSVGSEVFKGWRTRRRQDPSHPPERGPRRVRDELPLVVGVLGGGVVAELFGKDAMGFAVLLAAALVAWPLARSGLRRCVAPRRRGDPSDGSVA
jgi:hypothetical protein